MPSSIKFALTVGFGELESFSSELILFFFLRHGVSFLVWYEMLVDYTPPFLLTILISSLSLSEALEK